MRVLDLTAVVTSRSPSFEHWIFKSSFARWTLTFPGVVTVQLPLEFDKMQSAPATSAASFCVFTDTFCVVDLPPANRAGRSLVKFVFGEEDEHEEALYGTANHR
ncbi:hypothetical protein, partial [Burkholderia vietnamiensis]|uniref:hypothetical protein n=1 Tax=Burkholderia vietnamiensis TaxID=60552 RepID=UPI001E365DB9